MRSAAFVHYTMGLQRTAGYCRAFGHTWPHSSLPLGHTGTLHRATSKTRSFACTTSVERVSKNHSGAALVLHSTIHFSPEYCRITRLMMSLLASAVSMSTCCACKKTELRGEMIFSGCCTARRIKSSLSLPQKTQESRAYSRPWWQRGRQKATERPCFLLKSEHVSELASRYRGNPSGEGYKVQLILYDIELLRFTSYSYTL